MDNKDIQIEMLKKAVATYESSIESLTEMCKVQAERWANRNNNSTTNDLESVFDALGLSLMYGVVGDTQRRFVRIKDKDGNVVFAKMEKNRD